MTTEEKLERAVEFIKHIEKLDASKYGFLNEENLASMVECECNECGSDCFDIRIKMPPHCHEVYISTKAIDDLKEKAWHLLVDITE